MTRINFYIIEEGSAEATQLFICRLTEKAWHQDNAIYIHAGDESSANQIDDLLWSFNETSFIPHQMATDISTDKTVLIGHKLMNAEIPNSHHDVMINLSDDIPSSFSQFERLAEVIFANDSSKEKGRDRYRFYKDRGYALETHKISL